MILAGKQPNLPDPETMQRWLRENMAIDPEKLVLTARDMLTELPESVTLSRDNLFGMIKPAISVWQDQTNNDPAKRQNFVVTSTDVDIEAGIAEYLPQGRRCKGFRVEFFADGDVSLTTDGVTGYRPAKFVSSRDRLYRNGRQDKFRDLIYLQGMQLLVKGKGETVPENTNGTLVIASPVIPSDLADINGAVMYEIATVMADLAKKQLQQQNRGLDRPTQ
jgi:hypothetical protein